MEEKKTEQKEYKKMKAMSVSIRNTRRKALRKKRAALGLCTECGKPLDREGKLCTKCKDNVYNKQKERYEYYKSRGICPICGVNIIFEHESICPECKVKRCERVEKNKYNYRQHAKERRDNRVKNGLCAVCGKPTVDGKYRCTECQEKARKSAKKRPKKYVRQNWISDRMCAVCGGEPLVDGKRVCEKCYMRLLNSVEKREKAYASGEKERKQNQYWKDTNAGMIIHARRRSRVPIKKDFG